MLGRYILFVDPPKHSRWLLFPSVTFFFQTAEFDIFKSEIEICPIKWLGFLSKIDSGAIRWIYNGKSNFWKRGFRYGYWVFSIRPWKVMGKWFLKAQNATSQRSWLFPNYFKAQNFSFSNTVHQIPISVVRHYTPDSSTFLWPLSIHVALPTISRVRVRLGFPAPRLFSSSKIPFYSVNSNLRNPLSPANFNPPISSKMFATHWLA